MCKREKRARNAGDSVVLLKGSVGLTRIARHFSRYTWMFLCTTCMRFTCFVVERIYSHDKYNSTCTLIHMGLLLCSLFFFPATKRGRIHRICTVGARKNSKMLCVPIAAIMKTIKETGFILKIDLGLRKTYLHPDYIPRCTL